MAMQTYDQHDIHLGSALPGNAPSAWSRHRSISLAPAPESTRTARDFTITTLRYWSLDELISDTLLVVSELVANAIRHGTTPAQIQAGGRPVGLSWRCQDSSLICTVTDRSPRPPVLAPAALDAESGRGLQVVHALATTWGWTMLGGQEKAVWAAFQLPGAGAMTTLSTAPAGVRQDLLRRVG
jgi:anti-sigma regulatory factor (Ser/Thr protein kinase)